MVLAAGVGKRLGPFTEQHPKSLLRFGDETLLERHLRLLSASGIEEIVVVAGHLASQIEAAVAASSCRVPVRIQVNPLYRRGSALSVLATHEFLASSACLLMDADLLYERELLERLLRAAPPNCLLVDSDLKDSGEEVKVLVDREGWARGLGKSVDGNGVVAGESVGIFKFDGATGKALIHCLRPMAAADPDLEYETAISRLMQNYDLACVSVDGLAWIEIDFPEDVERARSQIYPRLAGTAV